MTPLADDPKDVEAVARAMCKDHGTAQCASICLSFFASSTRNGMCLEAMLVWGRRSKTALTAIQPILDQAVRDERERCARVARDGCLVPPDGGSPTEAEIELCDEIARRIRALGDKT